MEQRNRFVTMHKIGFLLFVPLAVGLGTVATISTVWFHPREAQAFMQAPSKAVIPVDGERAYQYLKDICKIGPHLAGTEANTTVREMVKAHFKSRGAEIKEQPFRALHPLTGEEVVLVNLIGSWKPEPENLQRVVIGAHYDTRPHADQEMDPTRRQLPFIGANDPGSGIAALMEIANHLDKLETPWGVDLVLFDGEELVFGNNQPISDYFLGSKEFARIYAEKRDRRGSKMRYVAGIVLDLIGGKDAELKPDPASLQRARPLVDEIWRVAHSLKAKSFVDRRGDPVSDDHLSLLDVGIPAIDLIDFNYPFWHKADDLPENCSAESLADVCKVLTTWLTLPKRRIVR